MSNLAFFFLICATVLWAPNADSKTQNQSIEQRLLELEERQKEFEEWYSEYYIQSKGRVSPFLGEKIFFGGFFENAVTHISGPDTSAQTSANSNLFGLNIAAEFRDNIRFVSQIITGFSYALQNPHNNPGLTPSQRQYGTPSFGAVVAHSYVEYRKSDALVIQTGLGYVPFGYAFQQREPVLLRRRSGPQLLGAADTNSVGLAFPLWMGMHIEGSFPVGSGRTGYNIYSFSPSQKANTLGVGARYWISDSKYLTAGISLQSGEETDNSYYSYGADLNLKFSRFGIVTEFMRKVLSGSNSALASYYIEPYYNFNDGAWLVYGVFDYLDNPNRSVGVTQDSHEKRILGAGVNWLPVPNLRFRLGFLDHDYLRETDTVNGQRRDYLSVDLSTGIAF